MFKKSYSLARSTSHFKPLRLRQFSSTTQERAPEVPLEDPSNPGETGTSTNTESTPEKRTQRISERDAELQEIFRERFGGLETEALEDGKPVDGLPREVKRNMFRLI